MGLVTVAVVAALAYYAVAEHADHLWEVLPLVLLAGCFLMHLIGHRHGGSSGNHGGHGR